MNKLTEMNAHGFPKLISIEHKPGHNGELLMELLGPSLKQIMTENENTLKPKTYQVIIQIVERLKILHSTGYVHGDIKPQNLCKGRTEK